LKGVIAQRNKQGKHRGAAAMLRKNRAWSISREIGWRWFVEMALQQRGDLTVDFFTGHSGWQRQLSRGASR